MKRSSAREYLMQMLYEMGIQQDFSEKIKDRYIQDREIPEKQQDYFNQVYRTVVENLEEIDGLIDASVKSWSVETMAKVDLAILRLAVAELLYVDSIPSSVSINEAVELGKKFGEENSGKFINGILGAVVRKKQEREMKTDEEGLLSGH